MVTDMVGQRFGKLTVTGDSEQRREGCVLWRCRCDCGGERLATRGQLVSGTVMDCGCAASQAPSRRGGAEDLTGRRFGRLTVLRRTENSGSGKTRWLCRCDCGNTCAVLSTKLKSGRTQSCGCLKRSRDAVRRDLTGRRFGRLTALWPVERKDRGTATSACWHCRCDCGNETDVCAASLLKGLTRSCGCLNAEQRARIHEHMHYANDTCIERLVRAQKDYGENRAGFRGLYQLKDGRYRVTITFRKVHYDLGCYRDFGRAVQARLNGEQALHQGYIDAYTAYQSRAEADPAWAEENPFYYDVQRTDGHFTVLTNGRGPAPEPAPARQETAVV